MSITPQAIKDQEFQSKVRSYDTIEVKAYLELLAEEFFELLEAQRKHEEERDGVLEERDGLHLQNENLMQEIEQMKKEVERLQQDLEQEQGRLADINGEMEDLQTVIADNEQDRGELEEEASEAEAKIKGLEEKVEEERREKETLAGKVRMLEERNEELKKEEVDFKSTLGAAQKFAQEVREKSEEEAKAQMARAEEDVLNFRIAASEELSNIPSEIEELRSTRKKVREELREVLENYLNGLEAFDLEEEEQKRTDLDDLFEKVEIGEDGTIAQDDLEKINMDLDLPEDFLGQTEDENIESSDQLEGEK